MTSSAEDSIIKAIGDIDGHLNSTLSPEEGRILAEKKHWLIEMLARVQAGKYGAPVNVSIPPGSGAHMHGAGATRTRSKPTLKDRLFMRMNWDGICPHPHISICLQGDKVLVWLVTNSGNVVIEDDVVMYPSDALVTKLRMM